MAIITRPSGVRVTTDDAIAVETAIAETPGRARRRAERLFGPTPMPGAAALDGSERADLIEALRAQEMEVLDEVELKPTPAAPPTVRGAPAPVQTGTANLELDLGPEDGAVLLLEQDGLYSWHFPSETEIPAPPRPRRRGIAPARTARFTIEFHRTPQAGPQRRGLVEDFIMAKARALVLRFAARAALGPTMEFLERNVRRALVVMDRDEPQAWRAIDKLSELTLPNDRPARLLLFVHGTFSSTLGSFGGLGVTPWGRTFLEAARANYDAVIGFDHPTLSEDPLANARDLLQRLDLDRLAHPPRIDAISYSRGGLVLRSLLEDLLPSLASKPEIRRAIFVAVVNGGTLLARPENWHTLIDLYTNLAAAACRVIALFPQATFGAVLMRELVQGIGAFAKYLATEAVTRGGIPGLAAMEPDGPFISALNQTQPGQMTPAESQFYAVLSVFDPAGAMKLKEIPQQLLLALTNGLIDQLMGEPNDLVVNTASMTMIDPAAGSFVKDRLDFGVNGITYHTNYFLQPQTVNALARWLGLQAPEVATPARRRSVTPVGGATQLEIPARVDTDVLVLSAREAADEALSAVQGAEPSFVVLDRFHQGQTLRYAYPAEELIKSVKSAGHTPLIDALQLHEYQASPAGAISTLPNELPSSADPTGRRFVALEGERVVGVVPSTVRPFTTEELVKQAKRVAAPANDADRVVRRRGLPSFAPAPAPAPAAAAEAKVTCHFAAEMEEEVELAKVATVEVTVSRETITLAQRQAAAQASGQVDPSRKLILHLLAKVNFESLGESRVELDIPAAGQPAQCYFDVQPTHEGEGEIWVVVRQGQVPLVNLILRPRIVSQRAGAARRINAPAITTEAPRLAEPLHQLRIFERRNGNDISYEFILDSPTLNLNNIYNSLPLPGDRNAYINNLYKEIENRWVSSGEDAAAFHEELRAFGGDLWDQLFPAGLQAELWQHREAIKSIMVFSEEPFIPWELVHMKQPGQRLGTEPLFLAQKGLVRWLHNYGWPPQEIALRRQRCRYVIPDYPHPDYHLAQAQEEAGFLQRRFGATPVDPQPNPVRELLRQGGGFDLLHFAGHGVAEQENIANAQLMLQGRVESGSYIPAYLSATIVEQFARLQGSDGRQPIVVINACQAGRAGYKLSGIGGFARAFLTGKAGLFVGALWSVGDQPARTFTESLYERLLAGDRLAEASIAAREKARASGESTWLAYVLYGHPHAIVTVGA